MLKIGKIYRYENKFWYVESKRKYRVVKYVLRKINASGTLGEVLRIGYKRGRFQLVQDARASITIEMPSSLKGEIRYLENIDRLKPLLEQYNGNEDQTTNIAHLLMAYVGYFDSKREIIVDLRILAKDLGYRSARPLYPILAKYYLKYTTKDFKKAVSEAADRTLSDSYQMIVSNWKYTHGYSKKLDGLMEIRLKVYMDEMKDRAMDAAIAEDSYSSVGC